MGGHDVRRWLSALLGLGLFVAAGTGAAFAASAGNGGGDNVQNQGGGGELKYQETIDLAFEDIQTFWAETLPEIYGLEYREIPEDDFIPYTEDDAEDVLPTCDGEELEYTENAFYCASESGAGTGDDYVAYDDENLFPALFQDFGPFALVQVLAHEWGHAIQGQVFTFDSFVNSPSIQKELQADCYAGAYVAWVDAEEGEAFATEPGDLETGLAGMLQFRDPPGFAATEEGAHGNGFDRTNAFSEGFDQGAARCVEYDDISLLPPVTEIPFVPGSEDEFNEGNLPLDEAIEFGIEDLDLYWNTVFEVSGITYDGIEEGVEDFDPRRKSSLPECEGLDLNPRRANDYRGAVFYCPDEEFIAYDENIIEAAHGEIGDFAAMQLIGNAWAAGMQEDLELEGGTAQVDCFAGSWAGSIPIDFDGDEINDFSANGGPLVRDFDNELAAIALSPGDLDEVVQAFLAFSEPATGEDPDELTAYTRLQSFRQGFFAGEEECAAITA
jgi:hypothetical protein